MKSYYLMIHYGSEGYRIYVDGYFVPNAKDPDEARQKVIDIIKTVLANDKVRLFDAYDIKEQLYSLEHPDEENDRGDKLCIVRQFNMPVHCGYWLSLPGTEIHLCNILK